MSDETSLKKSCQHKTHEVIEGHYMMADDHNQYHRAIEELQEKVDHLTHKLQDELMNFFLLGDHQCKCKCQQKDVYSMSADEYLNLENKL